MAVCPYWAEGKQLDREFAYRFGKVATLKCLMPKLAIRVNFKPKDKDQLFFVFVTMAPD